MAERDQRRAAQISTEIMHELFENVEIGRTGLELNDMMAELCEKYEVKPAFLGVGPKDIAYKYNLCISVNDVVLHGVPNSIPFESGDLVKLDLGIVYKGYFTDHCVTIGLGEVSVEDQKLLQVGKLAVISAVQKVSPGVRTGDLGYIMQSIAELSGFNVLKNYVGHGIGKSLWESPELPAYGEPGKGDVLKVGDVICIEAQVVAGKDSVSVDSEDNWSIFTDDGEKGVMFEYMIEVTKKGYNILTPTNKWEITK